MPATPPERTLSGASNAAAVEPPTRPVALDLCRFLLEGSEPSEASRGPATSLVTAFLVPLPALGTTPAVVAAPRAPKDVDAAREGGTLVAWGAGIDGEGAMVDEASPLLLFA